MRHSWREGPRFVLLCVDTWFVARVACFVGCCAAMHVFVRDDTVPVDITFPIVQIAN